MTEVMKRTEDHSAPHFEWLVAGRSRNQSATLSLYKVIVAHQPVLDLDVELQKTGEDLVAITFSLWRAVFLSDLTGDVADRFADIRKFLQHLIAHNAVLYQTDFAAREWTFRYYLRNAVFRLADLPETVMPDDGLIASGSAKEEWTNAQSALESAIDRFAELLATHVFS